MPLNLTNSHLNYVDWPVHNVVAFTSTTHHPNNLFFSSPFGCFNLGLHVGDDTRKVESNRQSLLDYLPALTSIQWLNQVHENKVEVIDEVSEDLIADASTTRKKNVALAIMTADCLPIILSTLDGSEIAAIHGGWKSLSKNIIKNTLIKMKASANEVFAWLGPCIGPEKFEVGEDVYKEFLMLGSDFIPAFTKKETKKNETKYLVDLHYIAKMQLENLDVSHIYSLPHCTFSMKDDYYSFRRQNITGRMATIICRS